MIKYLLLLTIIAGMSYGGKCQTTDTLCFPRPVLEKVLIAAKQKKVQDTLIQVYRSDISLLTSIRGQLEAKDSTNRAIILLKDQQRAVLEGQIVYLNKEVKKWKRKTRWAAIGGVVLTVGTAFLYLTK